METYREKLKRKYRKYRAILILVNSLGKAQRIAVDKSLENINRGPARKLREQEKQFVDELNEIIGRYGVVARLAELERMLMPDREGVHVGAHEYLLISKYHLSKAFQHYEKALPIFPKLPPHARIGIDINSIRESTKEVEVFQLEASLFEDMAILWNRTLLASREAAQPESSKIQVKLFKAILRGTVKAGFNLLEGYLNGLACDVLLMRTVSLEDRIRLEEWDAQRNRVRFLSLREKLLQYPKIASAVPHPPLLNKFASSVSRVVDLESALRHALIHPRPQVEVVEPATFRESAYFELTTERVAALIDDVIKLIQAIADIVGLEFGDVSLWLRRRNSDGYFPESTFD